jgi:solute carrier family 25 iron transporter 28/37
MASSSSSTPSGIHVHPHATHIQRDPPIVDDAGGVEDHDYESLPVGAGWGVNMMAGAMVSGSARMLVLVI